MAGSCKVDIRGIFPSIRSRLFKMIVISSLAMLWMLPFCPPMHAQESPMVFPGRRPPEILPSFSEEKPPSLAPPAPPEEEQRKAAPPKSAAPRVFVREIRLQGHTVFSDEELSEVTQPYLNRKLGALELEEIRRALTEYYIRKGYINSGALLPDQDITDGVVTFRIVEGRLAELTIEGNQWLTQGYVKDRIRLGAGPPLNIHDLQERLQLLQQDPHIQQLHGELSPGAAKGESELKVRVEESFPFTASIGFNNYQSTSVGAERGFVSLTDQSLTRHGDTLSFSYGRSEGADPQIDALYSLPFTPYDTTLTLRYRKNDSVNVREPFNVLDVESESDIYEVTVRHPVYRRPRQEVAVGFTGEHLRSQTYLLGFPFSFSEGVQDGESVVTALRFFQEWLYRTRSQVLAARSRFSWGLDLMDATINPPGLPDGEFFSWLAQFQWARIWRFHEIQTILRSDLQLSRDLLLAQEQIPVGGRFSVRGYPENQLVRDNAFIASFEARIPLLQNRPWADYLQLAPFVDFGTAWNTELPTPDPQTLIGIGLGLRWGATVMKRPVPLRPEFEIYWGYQLEDLDTDGNTLQDHGVHLQFILHAF